MTIRNRLYQLLYRYGFIAARAVWSVTKPFHEGALVMLWAGERVLLVRTSYQETWMAPGGGIQHEETPVQAGLREVAEEVAVQLEASQLRLVLVVEHFWNNRHDKVHLFEAQFANAPAIEVDDREVVEARFFTLDEVRSLRMSPHLEDYFRTKAAGSSVGGRAALS